MNNFGKISSTCIYALVVSLIFAQVCLAQVPDASACASCCNQLNTDFDSFNPQGSGDPEENVFNVFTCQTVGCVLNQQPCNQINDAFDRRGCEVGEDFRLRGETTLPDGDAQDPNREFFCSVGGELSVVEFDSAQQTNLLNDNNQCINCCAQLNTQFDQVNNDEYSVQACQERCLGLTNIPSDRANIDVFDEDGNNCITDEDDNIPEKIQNFFFNGCVQGDSFLKVGFVDFKGIRHFCQQDGLESVGAVVAQTTSDSVVGGATNDCSTCCDSLDAELDEVGEGNNYDVSNCREDGCHANRLCEDLNLASEINGCEIGKGFLTEGKVSFAGQDVQCLKGGVVQGAVVDVNEVIEQNNDAAIIAGGVGGGLAVLGLSVLAIFLIRRRQNPSRDILEPKQRPVVDDPFDDRRTRDNEGVYFGGGQYSRQY